MDIEYKVRRQELMEMLHKKYESLILSRKDVSRELGISTASLDRLKKNGVGPLYKKKNTNGSNGPVQYAIDAVVDFIITEDIKQNRR